MPFTLEEEAELNRLVRLERESVQILPVKIQTAAGIFESMQVSQSNDIPITRTHSANIGKLNLIMVAWF